MILDHTGKPTPPADILGRLKLIDPALGLKWAPGCRYDEKKDAMVDGWALTEEWSMHDPRRATGDVKPEDTNDLIDVLPADCPPEQAYGYVVRAFRARRGRGDIQRYLDRVHVFNQKRKDEILRPTFELAEELISTSNTRIRSDAVRKHKRETDKQKRDKLREFLDQ